MSAPSKAEMIEEFINNIGASMDDLREVLEANEEVVKADGQMLSHDEMDIDG